MGKFIKKMVFALLTATLIFAVVPATVQAAGWKHNKYGYWWQENDYSYPKNQWKTIYGKQYHFNSKGYMDTDWARVDGKWYYFGGKDDGIKKTYWQKVRGKWYWLGSDGAMRTGWQKVYNKYYWLGNANDGAMKTGWQKVGSTWYYLGSADDGYMQTGWKKLGTNWYYFGESNDGAMRTGFTKVGGDWYYFGGADDGAMKTGWQKIDGTWYFFNDDGMYDSTKKYDEIPGINDDKINGSAGTNNSNTNSNVVEGTYLIEGDTEVTVDQMVAYFEASKKAYPEDVMRKGGAATIRDFCQIYYEEAVAEGIKAEVAFVQAMKETGWLQFTGVVKAEQYNFAGMGATGNSVSGESFKDVREGVRAQIQHLKAYGSTKSLNQTCVDNRFKYVERGSAIYVEWLSIPNNPKKKGWAAAKGYGVDIVKMIQKLKKM